MRDLSKIIVFVFVLALFSIPKVKAQEWMKSLDVAKRLAVTQNKMLFVMWEEATQYELPVFIKDQNGRTIFIKDLLLSEEINEIIWDMFVPVLLNETSYDDMYAQIKDKRSYGYLQLFRDDSIKIMDAGGNILNTAYVNYNYFNFQDFVNKYALNTKMLDQELRNYDRKKDFYSAFYLGAKYIDFSIYSSEEIRPEIIELSNIYLDEAETFLENINEADKTNLEIRCELVRIKQELVLNNPRKVLRRLKRLDSDNMSSANKKLRAFLYFTSYKLLNDVENVQEWKTEVSLVNMKEANFIYKNLRN
ncbi:hypothetical protein [Winogradskyella aurantiaca]|uniref:hypothetical protein n=1 Tax=Winogradskyella aurantiaca TaxID=2219558 RepID=UPI000E1D3861|nr:hypothetical protein [Winogradskyella aurantiaca]